MSEKRPRRPLERLTSPVARRAAMSVIIASLVSTLVLVFFDRQLDDDEQPASGPSAPSPTATAPSARPAAIDGTYDVTTTVVSVAYGASWPNPKLTAGQRLSQRWSIDCRRETCVIEIASGHVVEDPDAAVVSTSDQQTFSVSGSTPASPDTASLPPGCGAVNATDAQRLTLSTTDGATFKGRYELHHPTIHVAGPVGDATGSCDSFNVVLDLTARRA